MTEESWWFLRVSLGMLPILMIVATYALSTWINQMWKRGRR